MAKVTGEQRDKITVIRIERNIENWTKVVLTFLMNLAIEEDLVLVRYLERFA